MSQHEDEDIREANRRISRPGEKNKRGRQGKVFAGQRAEFAANPIGDEGSPPSDGEKALERAARDSDRD